MTKQKTEKTLARVIFYDNVWRILPFLLSLRPLSIFAYMRRLFSILIMLVSLASLGAQSFEPSANVAIILPFNLNSNTLSQDKQQMRSVEFYQGALIAIERAQRGGRHINVQTYDVSTRPLEQILTDEELLKARVIIAPMDTLQVRQIALFGESHNIPVISPFSYSDDMTEEFPGLFQWNTKLSSSKAQMYERLSESLVDFFHGYQIVFVRDSLFQTKIDPYPAHLRAKLDSMDVFYQEYTYNDPYSVVCMDSALNLFDKHVLYVLETPQKDALRRFFPSLKNKLFLDANPAIAEYIGATYASGANSTTSVTVEESLPDSLFADSVQLITENRKVAILGYPDWQLYTNDFMEFFYDLNVWMFTKFYTNPFDEEVQEFYDAFKYWYNRELMPLYPKYGLLGYDVLTFALNKLEMHGTITGDEDDSPVNTLQSALHFEKCGNGGYVNRGLYLVHFTPETTIEKIGF